MHFQHRTIGFSRLLLLAALGLLSGCYDGEA